MTHAFFSHNSPMLRTTRLRTRVFFVLFLAFILLAAVCGDVINSSFRSCDGQPSYGSYPAVLTSGYRQYSLGSFDPEHYPSSRAHAAFFFDDTKGTAGYAYLFGGRGYDDSGRKWSEYEGTSTALGDIWIYDLDTREWMFAYGDAAHNLGTGHEMVISGCAGGPFTRTFSNCRPGGRESFSSQLIPNGGNDIVFGGISGPIAVIYGGNGFMVNRAQGPGRLHDIWYLSLDRIHSGTPWTRASFGSDTYNQGTKQDWGVMLLPWNTSLASFNLVNVPSSRFGASSFLRVYNSRYDDFYVFGGSLGVSTDAASNDLWVYRMSQGEWKWIHGNPFPAHAGFCGANCDSFHDENDPSARVHALSWVFDDVFYVFGGAKIVPFAYWSDMWAFDIVGEQWRRVFGEMMGDESCMIGTASHFNSKGSYSSDSFPGPRSDAISFVDPEGNNTMLFFGGIGPDAEGNVGSMNDLWGYNLGLNQWIWLAGTRLSSAESGETQEADDLDPVDYPPGFHGSSWWVSDDEFFFGMGFASANLGICPAASPLESIHSSHSKWERATGLWSFHFEAKCNNAFAYDPQACLARGRCRGGDVCECQEAYDGVNCENVK